MLTSRYPALSIPLTLGYGIVKHSDEIHPVAFYFTAAANNWNWTAPQNYNLWRDDMKTLFDPCPAGWRVPRSGINERCPWVSFTDQNGAWNTDGLTPDQGLFFQTPYVFGGNSCFLPTGSIRDTWAGTGTLGAGGASVCQWSTTLLIDTRQYHLFCADFRYGFVDPHRTDFPAYGFSVRCVRL